MNSICSVCQSAATFTCQCTKIPGLFCSECLSVHSQTPQSHPISQIDRDIGEGKRPHDLRDYIEKLGRLRDVVDRQTREAETAAKSFRTVIGRGETEERGPNSAVSALTKKLEDAFQSIFPSFSPDKPRPGPQSECPKCLERQRDLSHLEEVNTILDADLIHLRQDQSQQIAKKNVAFESIENLKREKKRLNQRIEALKTDKSRLEQSRSDISKALEDAKKRAACAEEEKARVSEAAKEALLLAKKENPPPSTVACVTIQCASCKREFSSTETALWRGKAISKTPEMSGIIPDLCSEQCYSDILKGVKEKKWFSLFS